MTRRLLSTLILAAVAALAPVAAADAAKPAPYPSVTKISPLNVGIGDTMTVTGRNFIAGKHRNTVVFKRDGKRAIFVKASEATTTTLKVLIPEKLRASLSKQGGHAVPTKFRIRVLSRRFAKSYTALKASPTVAPQPQTTAGKAAEEARRELTAAGTTGTSPGAPATATPPPDCDRDGVLDNVDGDDDNDVLTDGLEANIGTDRCRVDTDGDTMDDAWEYKSAFDLNQRSCPNVEYPVPCAAAYPYPGQRPYPNPLDGKDGHLDHDGDEMTALEEYTATIRKGAIDITSLWYSGGLQASQDSAGDGCRGLTAPPPFDGNGFRPEFRRPDGSYPDLTRNEYQLYTLDTLRRDGCLNDGERDEDGDYLNNFEEAHGSLSEAKWFNLVWKEPFFKVIYAGTDWLDSDSDGDTVLDGLDDQDHDDFLNVEEQSRLRGFLSRTEKNENSASRAGLWVDPFNPCLPATRSRTCPAAIPLSGDVYRPFRRWDADPPKPRWPLYGTGPVDAGWPPKDNDFPIYDPHDPPQGDPDGPDTTPAEVWDGTPFGLIYNYSYSPPILIEHPMPPPHPLPRCPGPASSC